jgi:hypothetical protein
MPKTFIFPIRGLTLAHEISIGPVRVLPPGGTQTAANGRIDETWTPRSDAHADMYDSYLRINASAVARVVADQPSDAYGVAATAMSILRLAIAEGNPSINTSAQAIGLDGEAARHQAEYLAFGPGASVVHGGMAWGNTPSWTIQKSDHALVTQDAGYVYLASALTAHVAGTATPLQERALTALARLNDAMLGVDPMQRIVSAATALEVLLPVNGSTANAAGRQVRNSKDRSIARRVAYLSCSIPLKSMCGIDRPACAFLLTPPYDKAAVVAARRSRLCTAYDDADRALQVRHAAVHEGHITVPGSLVQSLVHELGCRVFPAGFRWYAAHPQADVSLDMDIAIDQLRSSVPRPTVGLIQPQWP